MLFDMVEEQEVSQVHVENESPAQHEVKHEVAPVSKHGVQRAINGGINAVNFFDDKQSNIYDGTGLDLENGDNQQYTYHFQFIFYIWPLIKEIDKKSKTDVYYFEEPEYKPIIESAFISMKKALDCILQATPIVTDYSKLNFCTLNDKIISIFPFMNNEPEHQLFLDKDGKEKQNIYKEIFDSSILKNYYTHSINCK